MAAKTAWNRASYLLSCSLGGFNKLACEASIRRSRTRLQVLAAGSHKGCPYHRICLFATECCRPWRLHRRKIKISGSQEVLHGNGYTFSLLTHCHEFFGCARHWRPLSVRRYCCRRLLGLSGMVISIKGESMGSGFQLDKLMPFPAPLLSKYALQLTNPHRPSSSILNPIIFRSSPPPAATAKWHRKPSGPGSVFTFQLLKTL